MLPKGFSKVKVLYISLSCCPTNVKGALAARWDGGDIMNASTEFRPKDINRKNIEDYYKDQCDIGNHKGNINSFINEYGLQLEWWLMELGIDLSGVSEILITR